MSAAAGVTLVRAPHVLLDRRAGWRGALLDRLTIDAAGPEAGVLRLRCRPGLPRPLVDAAGDLGGLVAPVGVAVDCAGEVYVLDRGGPGVLRFDPCACRLVPLPCLGGRGAGPRQLDDPRALAVTPRGDLLVADTGNRRVQRFSLDKGALRQVIGPLRVRRTAAGAVAGVGPAARPRPPLPGVVPPVPPPAPPAGLWEPVDLVALRDCRLVVVDRAGGLLHLFDAAGVWRAAWDGAAPGQPPLVRPVRAAADREGRLYVIQEGRGDVVVLDATGAFAERIDEPAALAGRFRPAAVAVDEEGTIYLADRESACVHLVCRARDGSVAHRGPCRGMGGTLDGLAFGPGGEAVLCEARRRRVERLSATAAMETEGVYHSEPLDSGIPRCTWHRVALRARVAPGTRVVVHTLTSESPKPAAEVLELPESRWGTAQVHAAVGDAEWDCLVASPPGRYCWLRLTLVGNGQETPRVDAAAVYFPRASSIRWLPAVYRAEPASADFLDRFLSIFDRVRDGIADRITDAAALFDPRATPADEGRDFLAWLASWLDLAVERHWPAAARRRLVGAAHELYALRGTPAGLVRHLAAYTGRTPAVLEHFRLRRWLFVDHGRLGDRSALWGSDVVRRLQLDARTGARARLGGGALMESGDPLRDPWHALAHRCTVLVPLAGGEPTPAQRQTVERIVALAVPAHVEATVRFVAPRLRVGVQSFVGVDTVVGRYPSGVRAGGGALGRGTVLGPSPDEAAPPTMRIGTRARIGASTVVD